MEEETEETGGMEDGEKEERGNETGDKGNRRQRGRNLKRQRT